MYLPKNAASLISDSLSEPAKPAEASHEEMDEMEALGHSILQSIQTKDAKGLAENLKSFMESCDSDESSDSEGMEAPEEG